MAVADSSSNDRTRQFIELLGKHERRLANYVVALVPHWNDADDLIQQTKLQLWEEFDKYDPAKDFGAWACTIAHYQILAHRKTAQRRSARFSPEFIEAMAAEVSAMAPEMDHRHAALEKCLQELNEAARRLIALCYGEGRTIKEVAEMLHRSVSGTQKAMFRLRRKLQECIERRLRREQTP